MNIIGFERGKSPKEGLSLGIEGYKKKYKILVVETEFKDVEVAANSMFDADQFGKLRIQGVQQLYDAHFIIVTNEKEFMIAKMRFAPAFAGPTPAVKGYMTNWKYPAKDINDCIMWLGEEAERWNQNEDSYGFKL